MARGMANNEPIVSQARTKEFEEGYERIFGDKKAERGRWVYDVQQKRLVPADGYVPSARALDAPILAGRFYENTCATDGTDIGSRTKHRAYMKATGTTVSSDFTEQWKKAAAERARIARGEAPSKARREALERAMYRISKP